MCLEVLKRHSGSEVHAHALPLYTGTTPYLTSKFDNRASKDGHPKKYNTSP